VNFNQFDSGFIVTYFNATSLKLPFLLNDLNMTTPNNRQVVSSGYNDSSDLTAPFPRIALNISKQQGAIAWIRDSNLGNGVAMFDAPYLITDINDYESPISNIQLWVYPNPCSSSVNVAFDLKKAESLSGTIYNIVGKPVGILTNQLFSAGRHVLNYNIADLPQGSYFSSSELTLLLQLISCL